MKDKEYGLCELSDAMEYVLHVLMSHKGQYFWKKHQSDVGYVFEHFPHEIGICIDKIYQRGEVATLGALIREFIGWKVEFVINSMERVKHSPHELSESNLLEKLEFLKEYIIHKDNKKKP